MELSILQLSVGNLIRIGVIGLGKHSAENLIPSILELEYFQLTAVCSRSIEKANQYALHYNAKVATDDWKKITDQSLVDAVVIAATPELHAQIISHCIEKGIHVFVEKPPAPDTNSLLTLIQQASKKPNLVTFIDFNFRYGTTFKKALELVEKEGEIKCVKIKFVSSKPIEPFWMWGSLLQSLLFGVSIHSFDMANNLVGPFTKQSAQICWISKERMILQVTLFNPNGKVAFIELGNYSNRFQFELELLCSSGVVLTLKQHNSLSVYNSPVQPLFSKIFQGKETIEYVWPSLHGGYEMTGYKGALKEFGEAINSGKQSSSTLSACLPLYQVMDKVLQNLEPMNTH